MNKAHFDSVLRPLFRGEANFRHVEKHTSDLIYRVDWKLPAEGRPSKRSRPVEIHLSGADTLDDYDDAPQSVRDEMDRRVVEYVKVKLTTFDPLHDSSPFEQPPAEVWSITPDIASPVPPYR
jgi:hypothetical protein